MHIIRISSACDDLLPSRGIFGAAWISIYRYIIGVSTYWDAASLRNIDTLISLCCTALRDIGHVNVAYVSRIRLSSRATHCIEHNSSRSSRSIDGLETVSYFKRKKRTFQIDLSSFFLWNEVFPLLRKVPHADNATWCNCIPLVKIIYNFYDPLNDTMMRCTHLHYE